jgi:hypothetical protein
MGVDFLRRTAKSSTKAWDRNKAELSTESLFTLQPQCRTRSVMAELDDGVSVAGGEMLTLLVKNNDMILVRGHERIGRVPNPPADAFEAIRNAGQCALVAVSEFNKLSGTADVELVQ